MTIHLPENLADFVRAEVLRGRFGSEDELVAAAVNEYLRRALAPPAGPSQADAAGHPGEAAPQPNAQELQQRLVKAGVLSEVKPPITDFTPYRHRRAVPIQGEPLSETVIRERR